MDSWTPVSLSLALQLEAGSGESADSLGGNASPLETSEDEAHQVAQVRTFCSSQQLAVAFASDL